jgi:hypothetical protein
LVPSTHADEHEQAQLLLVQADVDVDAVGPQVQIVHTGQIALVEPAGLVLPLHGQLGNRRRGRARVGAEEPLQRRPEILARQAMQVQ